MPDPWFRDGLSFTCTRCGACCTGAPGYVWVNSQEIEQIAAYRGEAVEEFARTALRQVGTAFSLTERPNGDCVFYDREGRGCMIYPVRPRQCRTWPFWSSNIKTPAAWEETCKVCPGAGGGDFVSCEEVLRQAAVIRL
jgi:hypothetical protein